MNKEKGLTFSQKGSFSTPHHDCSKVHADFATSPGNCLRATTIHLVETYKICNPDFEVMKKLPARILTQPAEPSATAAHDNQDGNLICRVHDTIDSEKDVYTVLDILGTGTFGQVFRCQMKSNGEVVAVKVVKGKPAYRNQGLMEVRIAKLLNATGDPDDKEHIVRIRDSFEYFGHICIVFELLGSSILDILTHNQFRGLPLSTVQRYTKQLLKGLIVLQNVNVIHCDLKPENILLCNKKVISQGDGDLHATACKASSATTPELCENPSDTQEQATSSRATLSDIKMIDFGSACFEGRTMYSYIQSRFYRSPEVLVGVPYNGAIDMWSLGCVCAEMFLGLPLFPGVSQHNQLSRIVDMLGPIPDFLVSQGKNGGKFFTVSRKLGSSETMWDSKQAGIQASRTYRLKTAEEFAVENNQSIPVFRKYLRYDKLDEIILKCPLPRKAKLTNEQKAEEMNRRKCFLDFLRGLFRLNPWERWTAKQAYMHPFISDFTGAGAGAAPAPTSPTTTAVSTIGVVSTVGVTANSGQRSNHAIPFIPPPDPIVEKRLAQYQRKDSEDGARSNKGSAQLVAPRGASSFTPLRSSDRRESEPVVLPTRAQPPMERGADSGAEKPTAAAAEEKSLWSGWSLFSTGRNKQSPPKEGAKGQLHQTATSKQGQVQPRGASSENAKSPRRKSNPHSYSHHSYLSTPTSLFGSPPEGSNLQWQQQQRQQHPRGHYGNGGHDQRSSPGNSYNMPSQQSQTSSGQAYSFSGSMMSSLFHTSQQQAPRQQQSALAAQMGTSPGGSGGAIPIPMPSGATSYGAGQGVSSPYGSLSSSYGNSFFASSMGGVGNLAGLTSTDFGHALNRPELDENRYLQSFAFQQSLRQQQHGGSFGAPTQQRWAAPAGSTGSGQRPPLSSVSYSMDYSSTSGAGGGGASYLMGQSPQQSTGVGADLLGRSPQQSGSYMQQHLLAGHNIYPLPDSSPEGPSRMPTSAQHGSYQPQNPTNHSGQHNHTHGSAHGAPPMHQHGSSASSAASSSPMLAGTANPLTGRDYGAMSEASSYGPSMVDLYKDGTAKPEKNDSSRTIDSGGVGKTDGSVDDDMFFESDDLLG